MDSSNHYYLATSKIADASEIISRVDLCLRFCKDLSSDFLSRGMIAVDLEKERVQRLSQIDGFCGLLPLRKDA